MAINLLWQHCITTIFSQTWNSGTMPIPWIRQGIDLQLYTPS